MQRAPYLLLTSSENIAITELHRYQVYRLVIFDNFLAVGLFGHIPSIINNIFSINSKITNKTVNFLLKKNLSENIISFYAENSDLTSIIYRNA